MDLEVAVLQYVEGLKPRHTELSQLLSFPEVSADSRLFFRLSREFAQVSQLLEKASLYKTLQSEIAECKSHATTEQELQNLLEETIQKNQQSCQQLLSELKVLTQKNKNDSGSAIVELSTVASQQSTELMKFVVSILGAFAKKAKFEVKTTLQKKGFERLEILGNGAFGLLKNLTGVHFSNFASVSLLVLPRLTQGEVDFSDKDLRIDVFHSSGAGGQNVNKVESAVRITHIPTGISVNCQDERSQLQNKQRAYAKLKQALTDFQQKEFENQSKKIKEQASKKAMQKVQFYNFDEGFVLDLQSNCKLTFSQLQDGSLLDFLESQQFAEGDSKQN